MQGLGGCFEATDKQITHRFTSESASSWLQKVDYCRGCCRRSAWVWEQSSVMVEDT